jgi:hypothetical protein
MPSDTHEAVVCQHARADSEAGGSDGIAEAVGTEESIPKPPGRGGVGENQWRHAMIVVFKTRRGRPTAVRTCAEGKNALGSARLETRGSILSAAGNQKGNSGIKQKGHKVETGFLPLSLCLSRGCRAQLCKAPEGWPSSSSGCSPFVHPNI